MKNKSLTIIVLQSVLIIALLWLIIYLGKDKIFRDNYESGLKIDDEYELDDFVYIEKKIITLPNSIIINSGIEIKPITESKKRSLYSSYGYVLNLKNLIDYKTNYLNLNFEINKLNSQLKEENEHFKKLKFLNEDNKNIADSVVHEKEIEIQSKAFAVGVRVEHTQELIDQIQYKCEIRGEFLPPAPYSVVKQVNGRGVYSFCMCPGGIIAPCATKPGEVVTNGWSPSRRDYATSNSGIVVELKLTDFAEYEQFGPLAGLEFQKNIEQKAWKVGGETQKVPAQKLADFTNNKLSDDIPKTSYFPGTTSALLSDVLPDFINQNLQDGFKLFGKQMKGYMTNEAVVHAPESRSSSPVRIPRDWETLQHPQIEGLYPCGEGAGYAGGIISAAIDGVKCAEKC